MITGAHAADLYQHGKDIRKLKAEHAAEIARLRDQLAEANHWRHNYADAVKSAEYELKRLRKLLLAVKCGEFDGIWCEDVDGKDWFDERKAALGR